MAALAAMGAIAVLAFSYQFTTFAGYDDEGYFLQAYRDFLSGRILYDEVFSVYGPFMFLSAGLTFLFDAANVTHDNLRWITLPAWLLIASFLGIGVWKVTGRFSSALIAFLLGGSLLKNHAMSMGHPQLWIILTGTTLVLIGLDWVWQRDKQQRFFWIGLLAAVIILTKINVGIFVALAIALTLSLQVEVFRKLFVPYLITFIAMLIGIALMIASDTSSERLFALLYITALFAIVAVAQAQPASRTVPPATLGWLVGGFTITVCIGIAATLLTGTTLHALIEGLVTQPALMAQSYHYPYFDATRRGALLLAIAGIGTMGIGALHWAGKVTIPSKFLGIFKVIIGSALLYAFHYDHRPTLPGSLLFLWLLPLGLQGQSNASYSGRLLLALMSATLSLQLFPMAGSQVDWAALLPMTSAAVLLGDGINSIALSRPFPQASLYARAIVAGLLCFFFVSIGRDAVRQTERWLEDKAVDLPGTHWLHLPEKQRTRIVNTVSQLRNNCDTVLTVPGLYSFSIWSGVSPLEHKRFNSWVFIWPEEVLQSELPRLERATRGCALISQGWYYFWRGIAKMPNDEFIPTLKRNMRPLSSIDDVVLYRPNVTP